jgi:RHH-type proline utilization regulon transcriptional repressor/proline dehydrogenase/delta 1-pyrroline-5-carboxylate dehydrogenase
VLARRHDIGLNIDAEEADRLELSLDLLERLCFEPALAGWDGIGFVVQAYQKRCPAVVDWLIDLARRSRHRLMVRLVKGAYWDSEIKRAQVEGQRGYPVYTRKPYTDVAYLACARRLLAAPDAIYPQFATHNAHTLAAVFTLAGPKFRPGQYEFQCLHGMGEPLYEQVVAPVEAGGLGRPCRIYAPVGTHDTLLAYLVRRLLENGANTSFVNRIASEAVPLEVLVQDPVRTVEALGAAEGRLGLPHPAIPLPQDLYGAIRRNSTGLDLASEACLAAIEQAFATCAGEPWHATPLLGVAARGQAPRTIANPADRDDVVGACSDASDADVQAALACAADAAAAWAATPPAERASALEAAADRLEGDLERLLTLLVREAGKTWANAVAEVREAVDFLRYYAAEVRRGFDNRTHVPLGPVVCISPWNFPLAIFTGQVAAALAAGNAVLAKPAEQTPLVAAEAVRALHAAGIPHAVLQLLPGPGESVGAALVADPRVQGVLFTGSTEVARLLQHTLAERLDARGRPVTLIAETGGQNAMVVDSSALPEQVTADVLTSAFDSAGQRCSALRVLCVQREAADRLMTMLEGAMRELNMGDPRALAVDVGPVIDEDARGGIERHVEAMRGRGRRIVRASTTDAALTARGTFVAPTLIEIEQIAELEREVFGPVLHVLRYDRTGLPQLLEQIDRTGYGLTLGVRTRIDETVAQVVEAAHVGNVYVNRNVVGAVVGVQPFGGEGLSGTGPKAGGPLYLLRLLSACPADAARRALERAGAEATPPLRGLAGDAAPPSPHGLASSAVSTDALSALREAAGAEHRIDRVALCDRLAARSPVGAWRRLAGPTGEANLYGMRPRDAVLCLADDEADRWAQLAAVLALGGRVLWPAEAQALLERLPASVQDRVTLVDDWTREAVRFDAVLHHGDPADRLRVCHAVAGRAGAIVAVVALRRGDTDVALERLVVERSLSINTAAAGGNASLMTME